MPAFVCDVDDPKTVLALFNGSMTANQVVELLIREGHKAASVPLLPVPDAPAPRAAVTAMEFPIGAARLIGWTDDESRRVFAHNLRREWGDDIQRITRHANSGNRIYGRTLVGEDKRGKVFHVVGIADLALTPDKDLWRNKVPYEDDSELSLLLSDCLA